MGASKSVYYQPIVYQQIVVQEHQITQAPAPQVSNISTTPLPTINNYVLMQNRQNDWCGPNIPISLQNSNCCQPNIGFSSRVNRCFSENPQCYNLNLPCFPQKNTGYNLGGFSQPQQFYNQYYNGNNSLNLTHPISRVMNKEPTITISQPFIHQITPPQLVTQEEIIVESKIAAQPTNSSIIQSKILEKSHGRAIITKINPFANLPHHIIEILQKLQAADPSRRFIGEYLPYSQYILQKQAHYQGQWWDGYMQGVGRLYFDNGAYFEGDFDKGIASTDHGLFIYPDGSYFQGEVRMNVANGLGQFNYKGGKLIYKGQFVNDQPDGQGVELYQDGSQYQGQFRVGKKQGQGKFIWHDGTTYSGHFQNGFMQGYGIHHLSNGEVYEGYFRKNKRHGHGKHTTSLGIYEGGFIRDKKQGQGQYTWTDGKIFKGSFHNGKADGQGSVALPNDTVFYGLWINGVLDETSLKTNNPYIRNQNVAIPQIGRESIVSTGSIDQIPDQPESKSNKVFKITNGMLMGGFSGTLPSFVNQRASIVSGFSPIVATQQKNQITKSQYIRPPSVVLNPIIQPINISAGISPMVSRRRSSIVGMGDTLISPDNFILMQSPIGKLQENMKTSRNISTRPIVSPQIYPSRTLQQEIKFGINRSSQIRTPLNVTTQVFPPLQPSNLQITPPLNIITSNKYLPTISITQPTTTISGLTSHAIIPSYTGTNISVSTGRFPSFGTIGTLGNIGASIGRQMNQITVSSGMIHGGSNLMIPNAGSNISSPIASIIPSGSYFGSTDSSTIPSSLIPQSSYLMPPR